MQVEFEEEDMVLEIPEGKSAFEVILEQHDVMCETITEVIDRCNSELQGGHYESKEEMAEDLLFLIRNRVKEAKLEEVSSE